MNTHILCKWTNPQQTLQQTVNAKTIGGTLFVANTFVCAAQALASRVFPVPGAPYKRTPACVHNITVNLSIILWLHACHQVASNNMYSTMVRCWVWLTKRYIYIYIYLYMYKETTKYSAIYVVTLHKAAFGGLRNSHEVMKINSMWYIETHLLVVEYQCFQIVLCGSSATQ